MAFIHLHAHTEYNLPDGLCKIKELTVRTKEFGMDSMAVTDHGVMCGAIDSYKAAREAGIKPILGCEVYVAPGSRLDRETVSGEDRYYHPVLPVEDNKGHENLTKIVSKGFVDGFYYKPRADYKVLRTYRERITALSACLAGEVQHCLTRGMYGEAIRASEKYVDIFRKDNFFLEPQDHGLLDQRLINQGLMRMSRDTGLKLVATNDIHYTYAKDEKAHDTLLCVQAGKKVTDEDRARYERGQHYCKSEEEMRALFPYVSEIIENTHMIAERCNVEVEFRTTRLPKYEAPEGFDSWSCLNHLRREGFRTCYPDDDGILSSRLGYELDVIRSMGYVDYFLIVWDFINYTRPQDIIVGPGRGSAAGSIVSYALGITNIDPVRYNLLFERFLSPECVSMSDTDIDFRYERRQEVTDYVVRKYSKDQVVQIVTFSTLAAKGVARDVGRVLDLPYSLCDIIAKTIPGDLGMTLDKALTMNLDLEGAYNEDEQVHYLVDMSRRPEGLPRYISIRVTGVVIGNRSVDEFVPLSRASDGTIITQFTMTTIEELGPLKMDSLGLRILMVIQSAVRLAEKDYGITIDIDHIDSDDKKVLEPIETGRTEGVFQPESAGMKSFMKELKAENLEGIAADISLYCPGLMDFIPKYLKGKNDRAPTIHDCSWLEFILSPTYGCIVYQEQMMQIVRDLAGYTTGRSDLVRHVISKKKTSAMEERRQNFVYGSQSEGVEGCMNNGIDEKTISHIHDEMIDPAKYAFNKSHVAVYTVVPYQTAHLEYYYPRGFMAVLMTSVMDNVSKFSEYVLTRHRMMGIPVPPPSVNESENDFSVSGDAIRYGLSAIKSVGKPVTEAILAERERNGPFRSMEDFMERISMKEVNRRTLENFIKSDALDTLPGTGRQKMAVAPTMLEEKAREKESMFEGQSSLFDTTGEEDRNKFQITFPDVGEYSKDGLSASEKETLGVYISGYPLDGYEDIWRRNITVTSAQFVVDREMDETGVEDGSRAVIGGLVADKTAKTTGTNQLMAFIMLEDPLGPVEVIVFPRDYKVNRNLFTKDPKLFIRGRVPIGDDPMGKPVCEQVIPFDSAPKELWFQFLDMEMYQAGEQRPLTSLQSSEGKDRVVTYFRKERVKKVPLANQNVQVMLGLLEELGKGFGERNVKVVGRGLEKLGKMN